MDRRPKNSEDLAENAEDPETLCPGIFYSPNIFPVSSASVVSPQL